jgi:hypothetical protein
VGVSQSCKPNTQLPVRLGNRFVTLRVDSLDHVCLLLYALLFGHHIRAFETIEPLSAGAIYVSEVAFSIMAAIAVLIIEILAERLQPTVDKRARPWGRKRVWADAEVLCGQLDDDFLDRFVAGGICVGGRLWLWLWLIRSLWLRVVI